MDIKFAQMKIKQFTFNPFQENTYIVYNESTLDCAIIDPGCLYPEEEHKLCKFLDDNQLKPTKIVYTHCHLDHSCGTSFISEKYPSIACYGHANEQTNIDNTYEQGQLFGIITQQPPPISHYVFEGETIKVADEQCIVIETPGHSAGGVCYYFEKKGILFSGDTLFAGSVGRTDLMGGNMEQLINSIKNKLFTLPENVTVLCGHGYPTTIGEEKQGNPYIP